MWAAASALAATGVTAYLVRNTERGQQVAIGAIETCVEYYSTLRMKYHQYTTSGVETVEPVEINDIRIISGEHMTIVPTNHHDQIIYYNWNQINSRYLDRSAVDREDSLLHVVYSYQGQQYRIVVSQTKNQDLSIILDLGWTKTGFCNEIEDMATDLRHPHLRKIFDKYAGPLGDFYSSQGVEQDPRGFLDLGLSARVFLKGSRVEIYDPLGESIIFHLPHPEYDNTPQLTVDEPKDDEPQNNDKVDPN